MESERKPASERACHGSLPAVGSKVRRTGSITSSPLVQTHNGGGLACVGFILSNSQRRAPPSTRLMS